MADYKLLEQRQKEGLNISYALQTKWDSKKSMISSKGIEVNGIHQKK